MNSSKIPDLNNVPYFTADGATTSEQWPDPVDFGYNAPPEIPTSILPTWLGDFASMVSKFTQTPPALSVAIALSTVSACLQKRIEVTTDGSYKEPVNLWTLTQLPPGSRKTAVVELFTEPLSMWEKDKATSLQSEICETRAKIDVEAKRMAKMEAEAAKSDNDIEREALIRDIAKLREKMPKPIVEPRLWTGDVTPERLQGLLVEHGERMAVLSDEAAIFEVMSGLYSDGRANLDVFLQAHAGKAVRVDRGERMAHLDKPALTFGLAVQPQVVSELAKGSKRRFRGIGLLARFLYFVPESNIGARSIRHKCTISEETKLRYRFHISQLLNLPMMDQPILLRLDAQALESWQSFWESIEARQGAGKELESMQDWTAKLPGAALRIAGLFHACKYGIDRAQVDNDTMSGAIDLCRLLIEHARGTFDQMGVEPAVADAEFVCRWIAGEGVTAFKTGDIYALSRFKHANKQRIDAVIGILAERFIISQGQLLQTGGRSAHLYTVSPKFLKTLREKR